MEYGKTQKILPRSFPIYSEISHGIVSGTCKPQSQGTNHISWCYNTLDSVCRKNKKCEFLVMGDVAQTSRNQEPKINKEIKG